MNTLRQHNRLVFIKVIQAAKRAETGLSNLIRLHGHESILLREHPLPCNNMDFCVMHDANKRCLALIEAIAAYEKEFGEVK